MDNELEEQAPDEQTQDQNQEPTSPSLPTSGFARSMGGRLGAKSEELAAERLAATTAARGLGSTALGSAGAGATAVAGTEAVGAGAAIAGIGTTVAIIFFVVLVIIILLVGLIFVLKLLHPFSGGDGTPPEGPSVSITPAPSPFTPIPGLTLKLTANTRVNFGNPILYDIEVAYSGDEKITISDPLSNLDQARTPNSNSRQSGNTITWLIEENTPHRIEGKLRRFTFSLVAYPTNDNITIKNQVFATSAGTPTPTGGGGEETPTANMCTSLNTPAALYTNRYTGNAVTNVNFGDPTCDFAGNLAQRTDRLGQELNRLDPTNKSKWLVIAEGESTLSPNAANPVSTSGTAWGLYQMNPASKRAPSPYDKGDVVWRKQIENAINYNNKELKPKGWTFCYWAVARRNGYTTSCP